MKIEETLKQSMVNRHNFLEKKKAEFLACTKERQRKKLVAELIQLEPSHLAEEWVLDQVIRWMKDREKNIEYLKEAFIVRGKRDETKPKQRAQLATASFLNHKVEALRKKMGKKNAAVREMVLNSDDDSLPQDPEKAILQKLKRYRKMLNARTLPYPYYGKDVVEIGRGTAEHRIELYIKSQPVELDGLALFGDTTLTFPLK